MVGYRLVAGVGLCKAGQSSCAYNPVTSCYGCPKFMPSLDRESHVEAIEGMRDQVRLYLKQGISDLFAEHERHQIADRTTLGLQVMRRNPLPTFGLALLLSLASSVITVGLLALAFVPFGASGLSGDGSAILGAVLLALLGGVVGVVGQLLVASIVPMVT